MSYSETISYLYAMLPVFHRDGKKAYKADLSNTLNLCKALGNPHRELKFIHVAGTNGKGSTSHYLSSILTEAGYKTGLYTSPHLIDFTERFRINGEEISQQFIIDFVKENKSLIEEIKPSFFELSVVLAFEYFKKNKVEIVVLETGLGGKLDSTNVITPILSIITNIGFDHKDILGNTLVEIAIQKAGIIKPNVPIIVSQRINEEVDSVFVATAKSNNSKIIFGEDKIQFSNQINKGKTQNFTLINSPFQLVHLESDLSGSYQIHNLKGVLAAVHELNDSFRISDLAIFSGIQNVKKNTGLWGRWHQIKTNPYTICDIAHNEHGIKEIVKQINLISKKKLFFVLGFLADKDIPSILQLFPKDADFTFCEPNSMRAISVESLKQLTSHLNANYIPDVNEALQSVYDKASTDDFIYIGGSTFVVSEINSLKNAKKKITKI